MSVRGPLLLGAALALLGSAAAPPTAAQERTPAAGPVAPSPSTGGWGAVDIAPRPGNPTVSVTVVFPWGSSADPESATGASWLLARTMRLMVADGLDPAARAATEIAVEVGRSHTAFRMVTLPRYWEEAWGLLEWAVLRATPTAEAVDRARASAREVLVFERDAPHREFEVELYRLLAGPGSPWGRLPRGSATTLDAVGAEELAALRDRSVTKGSGVVSVVGAVDADAAAKIVTGGPALPGGALTAAEFRTLPDRGTGPAAWESGERVVLTREVTSSWIGAAWPIDPETPRTAREMLVDRLDREFNSDPPDPGAFDVDVRLETMGAHELLVVEAAVLPEAVSAWERRIVSGVEAVAADEMDGPFFRAYRRRFRGARLLADARPEMESLRRAMDLLLRGAVRDLPGEISGLAPDDLQEAADDLEEPRIFILGPDLTDDGSR